MSLFLEFHLIQNFAPSNLNRDDTGAPKDAVFGGYRRARVSSQCFKHAMRKWFRQSGLVDPALLGTRTRQLHRLVEDELKTLGLTDPTKFNEIIKLCMKKKAAKKEVGGEARDENEQESESALSYLLFISPQEIKALTSVLAEHADSIKTLAAKKKLKGTDVPEALKKSVRDCMTRLKAVDIALFGRMLADMPEVNQDAACQVAHAISTHRVEREFDYFTAVDDEGGPDETGAGMIGQVEFNSATFYRFAVIDAHKLLENLQGDKELTLLAVEAFVQAAVRAIPTGKQNTFAAHNPPSFVGTVIRHGGPLNLANAFEKPITAKQDKSLTTLSVEALTSYESQLATMYADSSDAWSYLDLTGSWPKDKGLAHADIAGLAAWVKEQVALQLEA
jgi:CRISPR system Cascade subunit CasC